MRELRDFRAINVRRCVTVWRKLEDWGADQWALRLVAETAELCNAVTQYMEGRAKLSDVMSEYADVYAYLDLLAARLYVSPEGAWDHVVTKFNQVSDRKGFAERLALPLIEAPSTAAGASAQLTFEEAWAIKERQGYRYGKEELEGVRLGWRMRDNLAEIERETGVKAVSSDATYTNESVMSVETRQEYTDWIKSNEAPLADAIESPSDMVGRTEEQCREELYSGHRRVLVAALEQRDKDVALRVLKQVQLALLNAGLSMGWPCACALTASQAVERIQMLVESGEWKP